MRPIKQPECPRCEAPMPYVIRGYSASGFECELWRQGIEYVYGGCEPGPNWYSPCPRCGWSELGSKKSSQWGI